MKRAEFFLILMALLSSCQNRENAAEIPAMMKENKAADVFVEKSIAVPAAVKLVSGRFYDHGEVMAMESSLKLRARIPLKQKELLMYSFTSGNENTRIGALDKYMLDHYKLFVLNDADGGFLDAVCSSLWDRRFEWTTYISDTECVIQVHKDRMPSLQFLYADSRNDKIMLYSMWDKMIGDVIALDGYIYYSTGFDSNIWRIDCQRGTPYCYEGYFPEVDLYGIENGQQKTVGFNFDGKGWEITSRSIRLSEGLVKEFAKKHLEDFLVEAEVNNVSRQ
jgi:hypothetical protein